MVKEQFKDRKFRDEQVAMIDRCNAIIDEYMSQDLRLSLRQLYYQLVSRNIVENTKQSYDRVGDLISDARLAGLVDWDAIEDRGREASTPTDWSSITDLTERALSSYRLPRWEGQRRYVELWCEKQALAGILEPIAREYHVTLMINKGYSSWSAMYESAKRYLGACAGIEARQCPACAGTGSCNSCGGDGLSIEIEDGWGRSCVSCGGSGACPKCSGRADVNERRKEPWLFYLGDHDPSGEDMVRDIKERMVLLGVKNIRVFKIGLTMAQIERYNPPPNPVKVTDARSQSYIDKFGEDCWEVDALPPNVLTEIVRDALERVLDRSRMDAVIARENADKERLRKAVARLEE